MTNEAQTELSKYKIVQKGQNKVFEVPNFLVGDFGRDALKEYNALVKADFKGNGALNVLSLNGNVVIGSNPYSVVLMNKVLKQAGLRAPTPAELEQILRNDTLNLRDIYEDTALVLRTGSTPNEYLAKNLEKQVKQRGMRFSAEFPLMIPLAYLELENDADSPSGLRFRLTENSQLIEAPQLAGSEDYKKFSNTDENGLPIFDSNGNRTNYTRESGLSRLCLDRNLDLYSRYGVGNLAVSGDNGRVVLVRDAVASAPKKAK